MKKLLFLLSLATFALASVDINSASLKELTTLKGIGKNKAKAIVAYRKSHCFKTVNDLMKVKGIGKKLLKKNRDKIRVGRCKR